LATTSVSGDGSHAEYRIVTAIGTVANKYARAAQFSAGDGRMPPESPIARSTFRHAVDAAFRRAVHATGPASAGDEAIVVAGAAADITALDGAANR
jgi:hypothetical protein